MGRGLGVGVGLGGLGVSVDVAVGVGGGGDVVGVGVSVAVGVGVGFFTPGAWISKLIVEPVLKKTAFPMLRLGGASASNRKLYDVPQRIALAFGFCAKVSEYQMAWFI